MAEVKAVRDLLDCFIKAVRDKDAKTATSLMSEDVTTYLQPPPLQVTGAEARDPAGMQEWFDTWDGPVGLEMPNWVVQAGDGFGYAYGLTRLFGRKVDSKENTDVWFRRTFCFRKIDGSWKIQADHQSVPYAMDGSLKALVDLKSGDRVDPAEAVGAR